MIIDYNKIAYAIEFYNAKGYTQLDLPWVASTEAMLSTSPHDAIQDEIRYDDDTYLVASAEQSFIDCLIKSEGKFEGKYFTVTPCFRTGDVGESEYHKPYFMKLELYNTQYDTLSDAFAFMKRYLSEEDGLTICELDNGTHDIFFNDIELGSYGKRETKWGSFYYGTGIAEPRLSMACNTVAKAYHIMDIPKAPSGSFFKIYEEVFEMLDAIKQENKLMELQELSDMIGACKQYINTNYNDITFNDILKMTEATERAFKSNKRK